MYSRDTHSSTPMPDKDTQWKCQTRYKPYVRHHAIGPSLPSIHIRGLTPIPKTTRGASLPQPASPPPLSGTRLGLGLLRLVLVLRPPRPISETRAILRLPRPVLLRLEIRLRPVRGIIPEPGPRSLPRRIPILGPPVPISQPRSLGCSRLPQSYSRSHLRTKAAGH